MFKTLPSSEIYLALKSPYSIKESIDLKNFNSEVGHIIMFTGSEFSITDLSSTSEGPFIHCQGTIVNSSGSDYSFIRFQIKVHDDSGQCCNFFNVVCFDLPSGGEAFFHESFCTRSSENLRYSLHFQEGY